jgi:hypothetical protein
MIIVAGESEARLFTTWLEPKRCFSGLSSGSKMLG